MQKLLFFSLFILLGLATFAQSNVGIGTTSPNPQALLELNSPNKGLLIPRLTPAQRVAIPTSNAENGLLVYDIGDSSFYYWNMAQWIRFPLASYNISLNYSAATQALSLTDGGGTLTTSLAPLNNISLVFDSLTNKLLLTDGGGTLNASLTPLNNISLVFDSVTNILTINDLGGSLATSLSPLNNSSISFDSLTNNLTITDGGGTLTTNLNINTDDHDWTRNTANGTMHPSNIGDRIGIGTTTTNPQAILELQSTTQGFLTTKMTSAQRLAMPAPPTGVEVFDITAGVKMFYNGARWLEIGAVPIGSIQAWHKSMAFTPPLGWGWVECNGQLIADPESPYNGANVPDLNLSARFLRGDAISGNLQNGDIQSHAHTGTSNLAGQHTHDIDPPATASTVDGLHNHTASTGGVNSGSNGIWIPYDDNLSDNCKADWSDDNASVCGNGWNGKNTGGNFMGQINGACMNHTHNIAADGNHSHTTDIPLFQSGANGNHSHTFTTDNTGNTETRPINMSVVWIMRIK